VITYDAHIYMFRKHIAIAYTELLKKVYLHILKALLLVVQYTFLLGTGNPHIEIIYSDLNM